jgi:hypothetical protein
MFFARPGESPRPGELYMTEAGEASSGVVQFHSQPRAVVMGGDGKRGLSEVPRREQGGVL